jgi:hypothetical protein
MYSRCAEHQGSAEEANEVILFRVDIVGSGTESREEDEDEKEAYKKRRPEKTHAIPLGCSSAIKSIPLGTVLVTSSSWIPCMAFSYILR